MTHECIYDYKGQALGIEITRRRLTGSDGKRAGTPYKNCII